MPDYSLPPGVYDARFTDSARRDYHATNHSDMFPSEAPGERLYEQLFLPRGKDRTVLEPDEIVLEIFSRTEVRKTVRAWDPFDKAWKTGIDRIRSGNRKLYWEGGGLDYLNSNFDVHFAGPGLPQAVVRMFTELGPIPGHGIALDREKHQARILDLFGLEQYDDLFEKLRRRALTLRNPIHIGMPADPIVITFRDMVEESTFEWRMLRLAEENFSTKTEDHSIVRNFQRGDALRSRKELAASGKVRAQFADSRIERWLMEDLALRRQQLPDAGKYAYSGYITPELAGTSDEAPDYTSIVINPFGANPFAAAQ